MLRGRHSARGSRQPRQDIPTRLTPPFLQGRELVWVNGRVWVVPYVAPPEDQRGPARFWGCRGFAFVVVDPITFEP